LSGGYEGKLKDAIFDVRLLHLKKDYLLTYFLRFCFFLRLCICIISRQDSTRQS